MRRWREALGMGDLDFSTVADAIRDGASEFRCKDCHGAVRLHGKHVAHGERTTSAHRRKLVVGFSQF